MGGSWRERARGLAREVRALSLAARDPRVPWHAKAVAAATVAYALSPIDLIPDFIPVLGCLDDLVIVPLGAALAPRLVPPDVMAECRERAQVPSAGEAGGSRAGAAVVVALWPAAACVCCLVAVRWWRG